jgi:hypothetical protein
LLVNVPLMAAAPTVATLALSLLAGWIRVADQRDHEPASVSGT